MRKQEKEKAKQILKDLNIDIGNFQLISSRKDVVSYYALTNNDIEQMITLNCSQEHKEKDNSFVLNFGTQPKVNNRIYIESDIQPYLKRIFEDVNSKLDLFEGIVVTYYDRASNKQKETSIINFLDYELSLNVKMTDTLDDILFSVKISLNLFSGCYVNNIYLASEHEYIYFRDVYLKYRYFKVINDDYSIVKKDFYEANHIDDSKPVDFEDFATLTLINIYN